MVKLIPFIFFIFISCGQMVDHTNEIEVDPVPETSAPLAVASFSGVVGQLEAGSRFMTFLEARETGEKIDLDVTLDGFDGDATGPATWFIIWQSCEGLKTGENPNSMACTGTQIVIDGPVIPASGLSISAGQAMLKGDFLIKNWTGPNQGLMSCILQPQPTD